MNVIGLSVIFFASNTWMPLIFDLKVQSLITNTTTVTAYNTTSQYFL
jgi:hypothetical protein